MTTQVKLKNSSVGGKVPLSTDLVYGELALNYADGKQYYKTSGNAIDTFASISATATLSNKTFASPTLTGATTFTGSYHTSYLTTYGSLFITGTSTNNLAQIASNNRSNGGGIWSTGATVRLYSTDSIEFRTGVTLRDQDTPTGGTSFVSISNVGAVGVTYIPGSATGYALSLSGKDTVGGIGYFDGIKLTNTTAGATNPNKSIRLNNTGNLEIINSAYTANIFTLTDAGVLSVPQISAGGSTGTAGQVLQSTGTGLQWVTAGSGTVTGVTATAPVVSSGGAAPVISMAAATASVNGYMTSTYAAKLDGIAAGATAFAGAAITDDTTTDATRYLLWDDATSGTSTSIGVSSSKLYFNPSTGTLNATNVNSLSDITFKENVAPIVNATETINRLEGVEFDWKDTNKRSYGVIAQELEAILPELVETNDQGVKSVNYSGLIGFLINSIKEMDHRIKQLENQ